MRNTELLIRSDGEIEAVGDLPDQIRSMGVCFKKRASHIVPLRFHKRVAFRIIRFLFGDNGLASAWTRTWSGPWAAVIIATGEIYIHPSRAYCLRWERQKLMELLERN